MKREKEVVNIMMSLFDVEYNLKVYAKNIADEAKEQGKLEGKFEGKLEGKLEIAKSLLDILDIETISQKTGLTVEEVRGLRDI